MKHILLLATGGTIASRPTAAGGLAPAITSEELLACVPELADLCAIDAVQLFNLDSTNVGPAQWQEIVRSIRENYAAYDGFVIAHGTDTLSYTAALLHHVLRNIDRSRDGLLEELDQGCRSRLSEISLAELDSRLYLKQRR